MSAIESIQEANRYYTDVCVEIYLNNQLRRLKWFSDLQLAYMYCMEQKELVLNAGGPEEDWHTPYTDFIAFADQMDYRWSRRDELRSPSVCALYAEEPEAVIEYWLRYVPGART